MVVFYDLVIAPLAARWLGRPISMTMRIGLGFAIQIVALLSAGFIELARYRVIRTSGVLAAFEKAGPKADPLDPAFTQPMRCVRIVPMCVVRHIMPWAPVANGVALAGLQTGSPTAGVLRVVYLQGWSSWLETE